MSHCPEPRTGGLAIWLSHPVRTYGRGIIGAHPDAFPRVAHFHLLAWRVRPEAGTVVLRVMQAGDADFPKDERGRPAGILLTDHEITRLVRGWNHMAVDWTLDGGALPFRAELLNPSPEPIALDLILAETADALFAKIAEEPAPM